MKFSNRPSECVEADGHKIWVSRNVAVIGHTLVCVDGEEGRDVYALMVKRGKGCPNEVGKWCLPCGYLDWEEDGVDGMRRETWEETGIDLDKLIKGADKILYTCYNTRQPWFVMSDHSADEYQNVCLNFGIAVKVSDLPRIPGPKGGESDESDEIKWVKLEEVQDLEVAFHHKERLNEFVKYLISSRK